MIKITVQYEGAVGHYPSYKKITTKTYFLGMLVCVKVQTSDAVGAVEKFVKKSYIAPWHQARLSET